MTWGEFKSLMDAEAVSDDAEIWYIDVHPLGNVDVSVGFDDDGRVFVGD